ncbi:hypothetical protein J6590_012962 [Homalodisca vitripennis]|nr:hypothetical protein J6590_012962 [Homalodisca vitripennis]
MYCKLLDKARLSELAENVIYKGNFVPRTAETKLETAVRDPFISFLPSSTAAHTCHGNLSNATSTTLYNKNVKEVLGTVKIVTCVTPMMPTQHRVPSVGYDIIVRALLSRNRCPCPSRNRRSNPWKFIDPPAQLSQAHISSYTGMWSRWEDLGRPGPRTWHIRHHAGPVCVTLCTLGYSHFPSTIVPEHLLTTGWPTNAGSLVRAALTCETPSLKLQEIKFENRLRAAAGGSLTQCGPVLRHIYFKWDPCTLLSPSTLLTGLVVLAYNHVVMDYPVPVSRFVL